MSAPNARALFAAARVDGPDAGERDAVFRKIALATGVAAGAAAGATALSAVPTSSAVGVAAVAAEAATSAGGAATAVAAAGGAFGIKLLAVGIALGAVTTALGVLLAVTVVIPESSPQVGRSSSATTPSTLAPSTPAHGARLAQPTTRRRDPDDATAKANAAAEAKAEANARAEANANAALTANPGGDLAEEARLLTAARTALMAGEPSRALTLVQATRKLSARSLEPEELGLEARALRALGRADDAAATELVLRRRYPDHALAR